MRQGNRIYLDNAATSWPKPEEVYDAVDRYQRELGVAAGRGSYADAEVVARLVSQTRLRIAKLIGTAAGERIVFTLNCTDSLNLVLHGLLRPGDHVVTSVAEHNSILRPLEYLSHHRGVEFTRVGIDDGGVLLLEEVAGAIRDTTRLLAITHASNVTGTVQPIGEIGQIAHANNCLLLVDAAQTIGHVPIDVVGQKIDLLAAPGHKGLMGPLGVGLLYFSHGVDSQLEPVRQGGTGTSSEEVQQPNATPSKYESGNLNVPGIVGLGAGVEYVVAHESNSSGHLRECTNQLIDLLAGIRSVTTYSRPNDCGIVSFNLAGYDPREVATLLDSMRGIQVRSGLHCAPLMHRALGTFEGAGTVRASCGHFTANDEVQQLADCVRELTLDSGSSGALGLG